MTNKAPALLGLAHIGVFTKDAEVSAAFYRKLGFTVDAQSCNGGTRLVFLSLGSCLLELIQPADVSSVDARPTDGIVGHIAIECTNIDELVKQLKAEGLVPESATVSTNDNILGGVKNLFFQGPSGESIELFDYYKR